METVSPALAIKRLDAEINRSIRSFDSYKITHALRETLAGLRQNLHDARIYTSDYELSETREEQLDNAKKAKKYLRQSASKVLLASQSDVFGAVEVAHISAQIENIISGLK